MGEITDNNEGDFFESAFERFQSFFAILEELESESDRGVAILGISLLDYRIRELLLHLLVPVKESKELIKRTPFAGRLTLALSTGLIERAEYEECNLLRSVRNDFAHLFAHRFSFNEPKVASLCRKLESYYFTDEEYPQEANSVEDIPTDEALKELVKAASPRQRFIRSVAQIYINWMMREFHTQHRQMKPSSMDLPESNDAETNELGGGLVE